jgi:predicted dehydrogenase
VPAFASLGEALAASDAEIVDVCLPTYLHREATIEALEAGRHVFCEKPMALTVQDADAMIEASGKADRKLMIGHCIRFWPEYALLKELVDAGGTPSPRMGVPPLGAKREGEGREGVYVVAGGARGGGSEALPSLGRLLSLNLTRYGEFPTWSSENWLADEAKAGGGALDMHIHDTDFALYLLGRPTQIRSWGVDDGRGIGQIFTTMRYDGGPVVHLEGGWSLPPKTPFKMAFRAIFEHGAAIMDGGPMTIYPGPSTASPPPPDAEGQDREGVSSAPNPPVSQSPSPFVPEFPKLEAAGGGNISDLGGYYHELAYFVDCVANDKPLGLCLPESSRESLEVCLKEIWLAKSIP